MSDVMIIIECESRVVRNTFHTLANMPVSAKIFLTSFFVFVFLVYLWVFLILDQCIYCDINFLNELFHNGAELKFLLSFAVFSLIAFFPCIAWFSNKSSYTVGLRSEITSNKEIYEAAKRTTESKRFTPIIEQKELYRLYIRLGFQLGRYEITASAPGPEAKKKSPTIMLEIVQMLESLGLQIKRKPHSPDPIKLIQAVLVDREKTDLAQHAAILTGLAAQRASLISVVKEQGFGDEMISLSQSAITEIDSSIINRKKEFFKDLRQMDNYDIGSITDVFFKYMNKT